ncbi:MAG: DUF3604 domain-containing protein [Congregibacter sp.]
MRHNVLPSQTVCRVLGVAVCAVGLSLTTLPSNSQPESATAYSPNVLGIPNTEVFFGDTHVHTGLSGDAGGSGTRLMPDAAYRFARGEQVTSNTGQPVRLARPYDFFMITDHSDGMGLILDILAGAPNIMADPDGRRYHEDFLAGGERASQAMFRLIGSFAQGNTPEALLYQPGRPQFKAVWEDLVKAAEDFYEPGVFTTFIAYEWTSLVSGNNLHRNVIFRDGGEKALQVEPFTATPPIGSRDPRDLWQWMSDYETLTGGDVTAIPHNGNLSNGMMFPLKDDFAEGGLLDRAYAESRARWERIYEVSQYKGDGETHPLLSPDDEFADFETWDYGNLDVSEKKTPEMLPGEYARSGLLRGLQLQASLGVNPYKLGFQAGTDTHTGLSTADEDNFFSKFTTVEPSADRVTHRGRSNAELGVQGFTGAMYNASGITAVWATENTREAIFDAMERRETYATTGPRIGLRFFGGWNFSDDDQFAPDLAKVGYGKGQPMGGDLPPTGKDGDADAPAFLISALRDPTGANLDRVQVIKGWLDESGETRERVYNVSWSDSREPGADGKLPPVGNTVDLSVPNWSNSIGSAELRTVWRDPDFDPTQPAFYYLRVLEIPTPRWTAYDAVRFGIEVPENVPLITQERAYSSPIWYTP